jgi:hypothetical protein
MTKPLNKHWCAHQVVFIVQHSKLRILAYRDRDFWLFCQSLFQSLQPGQTGLKSKAEAIRVDDDTDKVRVVKGRGGTRKRGVAEVPAGRPLLPEKTAQVSAVAFEAFASALGLELGYGIVSSRAGG